MMLLLDQGLPRSTVHHLDAAGVVQLDNPLMKELQDACCAARRVCRFLNAAGHGVSQRSSAGWSALHCYGYVPARLQPDTCPRDPLSVRG